MKAISSITIRPFDIINEERARAKSAIWMEEDSKVFASIDAEVEGCYIPWDERSSIEK